MLVRKCFCCKVLLASFFWPCLGLPSPTFCLWLHWYFVLVLVLKMWSVPPKKPVLSPHVDLTLDGVDESAHFTYSTDVTVLSFWFQRISGELWLYPFRENYWSSSSVHLWCQHGISIIPSRSYSHLIGSASVWGLCGIQLAYSSQCGSLNS